MNRICFVSLSAYGYFDGTASITGGGAQRQLSLLARELTDEFSVHFIVGDYGQPQRVERDGITLHRAYRPDTDASTVRKPLQFGKLWRAMSRANADLYVTRSNPQKAGIVYLLSKLLGRRFVFNVGYDPNLGSQVTELPPLRRFLYVRALLDGDGVIAQTADQAEILRHGYGIEPAVVPNGYPPAQDILAHTEREQFIWVGRLEKDQKRPHRYLDLAAECPDYEFLLIGPDGNDGPYATRIRDRASEMPNVTDIGPVPPDEIHRYFRQAIALVNTSRYEGFPNTFLEAWRYETPVITLDIDPNRFIEPSVDGFADGDFEQLVALVDEFGANEMGREQLGKPAREYVNSALSLERVAKEYATALLDVLREEQG